MRSPSIDHERWALLVQRLMDADLLLPEEGNALLAELEAWSPPAVNADARRANTDGLTQALEAIVQTDRLDVSARQAALKTAHALIHQPTDSPEA